MQHGFVSKKDYRFPDRHLDELFLGKENCVYFIEDAITHKWVCEKDIYEWTTDPALAMAFETNMKARTFAIKNNLSGWVIVEHKLLD